jgi:hypothetical protein
LRYLCAAARVRKYYGASMTEVQRQRLFDALMEGIPGAEVLGVPARREMEELTANDLNRLEPLIDEMILEATQRKAA